MKINKEKDVLTKKEMTNEWNVYFLPIASDIIYTVAAIIFRTALFLRKCKYNFLSKTYKIL